MSDADFQRIGTGNWQFPPPLEKIYAAADAWRRQLEGVEKPWLCWNVNSDWCAVQQRLVVAAGWTPVVGFDPPAGPPAKVHSRSVVIDFNADLAYPRMWLVFPLQFMFLFTDRLAFWHSDLLCRVEKIQRLATLFAGLPDKHMAAVRSPVGLRYFLRPKHHRYFELIGCTTRGASHDQFIHGCGWWRNFALHPNGQSEAEQRRRQGWEDDHGYGIMYWKRNFGGRVHGIDRSYVEEGHCTAIGNPAYVRIRDSYGNRDLARDLAANFDLAEVCGRLGLSEFLDET